MFGLVIIIFFCITSVKLSISLFKQKEVIITNGITPIQFTTLQVCLLLTLIPIIALSLPVPVLRQLILPIPFGIVFFVPAILVASKITKHLSTQGTDLTELASRTTSNIKWLGYGGIIIILFSLASSWFMSASWLHNSFEG